MGTSWFRAHVKLVVPSACDVADVKDRYPAQSLGIRQNILVGEVTFPHGLGVFYKKAIRKTLSRKVIL